MSIIAAGTTTTTALSSTGNTDGTLQFQVNGTTPSVTLNTLGAIGVGSTPGYGTSGQVLTSAGSTAAPTWTTNVSSQWTTTGSDIYYNTGNVGIGVAPSNAAGYTTLDLSNATSGGRFRLLVGSNPYGIFYTNGTTDVRLMSAASVPLLFGTNYNEYLRIGTAGQIGLSGANYGTSGQVLTSGGSGAAPTWSTPSAGALVLLSTQTVSSAVATVDFSNLFSSTYDDYVVYFGGVTSTDNYPLCVRLQKNGAFGNAGYNWDYVNGRSSGTAQTSATVAASQIQFGPTATLASNNIQGGFCTITNANSATGYAVSVVAQVFSHSTVAGNVGMMTAGGTSQAAYVTTGIQFLFTTGNVTAGTFRLYGIAKS